MMHTQTRSRHIADGPPSPALIRARRLRRQFLATLAVALVATGISTGACAQGNYPNKPVRILVGFPPGGSVDIIARIFAQKLQESLGQPFVVENRPGAGGSLAAHAVAQSQPDGYTLLLHNSGTFDNAVLSKNVPYNIMRDFTPIAFIGSTPRVLAVGPTVTARTAEDLIVAARAKPGAFTYASDGLGASGHIGLELFSQMADVKMLHVPYKGGSEATAATAGGQTDMMFLSITTTLPMIKSGKLRALAVSSLKRSFLLPSVPTLDEAGLKGFEQLAWFGIAGPLNMPKNVLEKLRAAVSEATKNQDVREALQKQGIEIEQKTPEEFEAFLRRSAAQTLRVAERANIKLE